MVVVVMVVVAAVQSAPRGTISYHSDDFEIGVPWREARIR